MTQQPTDEHVLLMKKFPKKGNRRQAQLVAVGGVKINRGDRIKVNGTKLTIARALPRDAGTYMCSFQTMPSVSLNHTLDVQYAPSIRTRSTSRNRVMKGGQVLLACKADGNPTPKIRWSRQEGPMPSGDLTEEVSSCLIFFNKLNS